MTTTFAQDRIEVTDALAKYKSTTFKVCKTSKSGWVKDGTGFETGVPAVHMSTSKTMMLEPISRLYLGKGNGYMPTQYVIGAPTTYIRDYYEDANGNLILESLSITAEAAKKKNYQYRPGLLTLYKDQEHLREEYRRSIELGICFENGRMQLSKYGDDPVLLKFIMEHEQNKFAPRSDENTDPKRIKLFQFEPEIKELQAKKSRDVDNFDFDFAALEMVGKTRSQKADKTYEYREDIMDAILTILESGIGLKEGDVMQKFNLILKAAKSDGRGFITKVSGAMEEYRMSIGIAEEMEVLEFGAKEAKIVKEGEKHVIYTFHTGTDKKENVEELILFFLSGKKGQEQVRELKRYVDIAKIAAFKSE